MQSIYTYGILSHNQTQLKYCSFDNTRSECMTDLELLAINFDRVKTEYLNNLGYSEEKCKSVDAILEINTATTETKVVMIEFKNGKIERENINIKARDSLLLLCAIMGTSIEETREHFTFVLVYNQDEANLQWDARKSVAMSLKAGKSCPVFKLDKMEGVYFRKALMVEKKEFEKWLNKQYSRRA